MNTKIGWMYVGVLPSKGGKSTRWYGLLIFNEEGKLMEERTAERYTLLKNTPYQDSMAIKKCIVEIVNYGTRKKDRVDFAAICPRIFLVDPDVFERMARKSGAIHYELADRYRNLKRPFTVFFTPTWSPISLKVKSKSVLLLDANGKAFADWGDPNGHTLGFAQKGWSKKAAIEALKGLFDMDGIQLKSTDRIYWLTPRHMKEKLIQFGMREESLYY